MISIVIPVYNEGKNVRLVAQEVAAVCETLWQDYELIFVDDGSSDGTDSVLRELCTTNSCVRLIVLSRNFGHQAALSAGLEAASGDAVVTMDADMQHPPQVLPELIAKWQEGFEVVHAARRMQTQPGRLKRFASRAFYAVMERLSETPVIPNAADFRLMDRVVVEALRGMPERSRFLRGMVSWTGFRQAVVRYTEQPRANGHTKYSLKKMSRLALSGITGFSTAPLRLSTYLGLCSALACVPYVVWAIYARLFTDFAVPGWASLLAAVVFLGGVQLICLGIMGEYIGRIYDEVKQRPQYLARERVGFAASHNNADRSGEPRRTGENEPVA